jgi:uncharacterized integral membrane protein
MSDLWLKIWVWIKGILIALVALYVLLFVVNNSHDVTFWWFPFKPEIKSSTLVLIGIAFLAGVVSTILVRTTLRTVRQVQEIKTRNRSLRLERDMAEMKSKAAMLKSRPAVITEPAVDQEPLE